MPNRMTKPFLLGALYLLFIGHLSSAKEPFTYPDARRSDQVDDYHGTKVADPYRWLEDPDSSESRAWIEAENKVTFDFLGKIPERDAIRRRITALWDYEKFGVPFKEQGRYFISRNTGLQNQSVLFVASNLKDQPRELLDPNTLAKDGTVALGGLAVSDNAKLMAYGLAASGSDWQTWKVRDVETGTDRDDELKWVKFSGASWLKDGTGFFYCRYEQPDEKNQLRSQVYNQRIYLHKIGTPQSADTLVYERPDHKEWLFSADVTDDGRYLIIAARQGTSPHNRVFYQDLKAREVKVKDLLPEDNAAWHFIDNDGPVFYFHTDSEAPLYRVVAIDTTKSLAVTPREVIPQGTDKLEGVTLVGERFVANYLHDAHSVIRLFQLDGAPAGEIALPGIGTAGGFPGKRNDRETFYSYTSYTTPTTIFRYDFEKKTSEPLYQPKLKFDPANFTTEQVFYHSADGTRVPMFISYKKGMQRDGQNPTYLYAYGGFDASITPNFNPALLQWMEMGGLLAVPNLRGGGEYGEKWHEGGMKHAKQNVFDDFIAAAEYLVEQKYTSTPKLAIAGGSNGGLLVGACLTQRPDLFGATLPAVGVMDMLRFQKFTVGWAWASDYGSSDNADDFPYIFAYSPLHHIAAGTCYPPTLVTTADHDDRVVPAHSFKFAATLQAAQGCDKPVLIRIETKAGHGAGKPTTKIIEETADRWAFLVMTLGMSMK